MWETGRTGSRHSRWPGWRKCTNPRWREPPCRSVTRCSKPQTDKALRLVMARRAVTVPVLMKNMTNHDDHSTDKKMVKDHFSSVYFRTHLSCPVLLSFCCRRSRRCIWSWRYNQQRFHYRLKTGDHDGHSIDKKMVKNLLSSVHFPTQISCPVLFYVFFYCYVLCSFIVMYCGTTSNFLKEIIKYLYSFVCPLSPVLVQFTTTCTILPDQYQFTCM